MSSAVAVSATGKVLFTGGFLVLDRQYRGLVFGLDARIHVHIQPWVTQSTDVADTENRKLVLVESPQFKDARWLYEIDTSLIADNEAVRISQLTSEGSYTTSRNKFVEVTLHYVLAYLAHKSVDIYKSLRVTILADDDYYSQSATSTPRPGSNFTHFGVTLSNAHKTGLGSSAALVTSLVAALLNFYAGTADTPPMIIHNLAQAAHCAAQGKVGSGFDVAAAVFGSCLYRRFTPIILENVGEPTSVGFGDKLYKCVDDLTSELKWDVEISSKAVQIPQRLLLVMCDVDCGSETPGMVKKVLQWRKEKPKEADLLWDDIQRESDELATELKGMSSSQEINAEDQQKLRKRIGGIRKLVKDMSRKSGVPIEPDVITELLDYCTKIPGVIGGVAPGAGGYDAVALLIRNDAEILRDLQARLKGWTSKEENTGASIGQVRLLNVKQSEEGLRMEDATGYGAWM